MGAGVGHFVGAGVRHLVGAGVGFLVGLWVGEAHLADGSASNVTSLSAETLIVVARRRQTTSFLNVSIFVRL